MSPTHTTDLAEVFKDQEDPYKARAQYLEVVLAAVLRRYTPKNAVLRVDLIEAARKTDVFVHAIDSSDAVIVWDDINESEQAS